MKFTELEDGSWMSVMTYKCNRFFAYGLTKQEAGSNCMDDIQKHIDELQELLNKEIT